MWFEKILEEVELFVVPAMNPDGINYPHHDNPGYISLGSYITCKGSGSRQYLQLKVH